MKLYINKDIDSIDLDEAMESLSQQRREAVARMTNPAVRRQSIAAYLLLCRALREQYGIVEPPIFAYEEGGKPFLLRNPAEGSDASENSSGLLGNPSTIHFNFSHCKGAVACAVSDSPVGVDIETIRPFKDALCRKVMSEEEYNRVVSAESPDLEFTILWTRKEALLKLTGEGIRDDLRHILNRQDIKIETKVEGNIVYSVAENSLLA